MQIEYFESGDVKSRATLDELLTYVVTHFSHEQQLMESSGYPAFAEHLKLHEQFSVTVADFLGAGERWSEDRVETLRRFLNRWLIGHIMTHDLRFGNWYRDHHAPAVAPPAVAPPPVPVAAESPKVGDLAPLDRDRKIEFGGGRRVLVVFLRCVGCERHRE